MPKLVIPLKTRVFADVPSSVNVNDVSGAGEPTKEKPVDPSTLACLTTVMDDGNVTAALLMERSLFPELQLSTFEQEKSSNLMWYGEPAIAAAE